MQRWMSAAVLVLGVGCFQVVSSDVVGPHGEHLMELQCPTPEDCMKFARETCAGDFDIVTNQTVSGGRGGTSELILVQCKRDALPPLPDGGR
jgi:hypothetical protein